MSRIKLLQSVEIKAFDSPPAFTAQQREYFFSIPEELLAEYEALRQPYTRLGFLLQMGYFRSQGRFYPTEVFRPEDQQYLAERYRIPIHRFNLIQEYSLQSGEQHRTKMMRYLCWSSFEECRGEFEHHIDLLVDRQLLPRKILGEIKSYLFRQRIEAPAYDTYLKSITQALLEASKRNHQALETHLTEEHKKILDSLLLKKISPLRADIVFYKQINQSLQPKAIKKSLAYFKVLKEQLESLEELVKALQLSDATIEYHAYWTSIAGVDKIEDHQQNTCFCSAFSSGRCGCGRISSWTSWDKR